MTNNTNKNDPPTQWQRQNQIYVVTILRSSYAFSTFQLATQLINIGIPINNKFMKNVYFYLSTMLILINKRQF